MEYYEILNNDSRSRDDRYKNCKLLKDKETGEVILSTRRSIQVRSTPNDIYHQVASNETTRLDILAHKYYRNPLLWWVIAQANDIYDPLIPLVAGSTVRIPPIETLYGNNGILL